MNLPEDLLRNYQKNFSTYKQEIDLIVSEITEGDELFGSIIIQFSFQGMPECCFQRVISCLYTLYWEVGKKSDIKFLVQLFETYDLDKSKNLSGHFYLVQSLRTILQHNITNEDSHNVKVKKNCSEWFKSTCGVSAPENDSHWEKCLIKLVEDSQNFLAATLKCIQHIKSDESRDEIVYQWNERRKRYFTPWDYDKLIREVIGNIGVTKDVVKLRNRHQSKWNTNLANLSNDSDFRFELKKLILDTLLEDQEILMPLMPEDIILEFCIEAGSQEIFKLLARAKKIFRSAPDLTKKEILERLVSENEILMNGNL
jgi:hypothetical protein